MRLLLTFICLFGFMTAAYADNVTVFAAASTTNAVNGIIKEFTAETGMKVTPSYASSGTLAKQIDNSAPADIFISANQKWMKYLKDQSKVEAKTVDVLLANGLVLIAPASSKVKAQTLDKDTVLRLISGGKIAVGDPSHVPAGLYAEKTLKNLGIWDRVQQNLARMQTVRAALALVERNAVPFGIVYSSDAELSKSVKTIGYFDEKLHGPIRYPYAIVTGKENPSVKAFYKFLKGEKSAKIFEKYGFKVIK